MNQLRSKMAKPKPLVMAKAKTVEVNIAMPKVKDVKKVSKVKMFTNAPPFKPILASQRKSSAIPVSRIPSLLPELKPIVE